MSARQYRFIADQILSLKQPRVFVIGAGHDTELWFHCSKENLVLVENDRKWIPPVACQFVRPRYQGKVGVWLDHITVPKKIARPWDIVLVDAPTGYSTHCIGRQEPIAWAAQFGKTVFVHNYGRPWERRLCDHYLGSPAKIIPFKSNSHDRLLAVFKLTSKPLSLPTCAGKSSATASRSGS